MDTLYLLLVFLLMSTGIFLITDIDDYLKIVAIEQEARKNKREKLKETKITFLDKVAKKNQQRKQTIRQIKMPKVTYMAMTIFGMAAGGCLGWIFFQGIIFVISVALMGALAPVFFINVISSKTKSARMAKLQSSMMILSSSYIITEDIVKSVTENIHNLEYPAPFEHFLANVRYVDNVTVALRRLEKEVNNIYFSQWIDVLVVAQDDRNLKFVTMSVVDSMNDVAQVQMEADSAMYAVWREYFLILFLIFSTPLILKFLLADAYYILISSAVGQFLLVLLLLAVIYSIVKAIAVNKPMLM